MTFAAGGARPYNFSAGPAAMPEAVLRRAADEMLDWQGSGMSVMEMSHRGKEFGVILAQAESDLRALLAVPAHFHILFMQGGGLGENGFAERLSGRDVLGIVHGADHAADADLVSDGAGLDRMSRIHRREGLAIGRAHRGAA